MSSAQALNIEDLHRLASRRLPRVVRDYVEGGAEDHVTLRANREALEFYGQPADQVVGRHLSAVLGEAVYAGYLPWAERLFNGDTLRWQGWVEYPTRGRRLAAALFGPYPTSTAVRPPGAS